MKPTVAVIGAGFGGLAAAIELKKRGYEDIVIFEKADDVGGVWRDKEGLAWVSAYDPKIWEYNIRVAEDMARAGFAEIQFDYIRFPEPYPSLPRQVFPTANGRTKQQALAEFLRTACPRIRAAGARQAWSRTAS